MAEVIENNINKGQLIEKIGEQKTMEKLYKDKEYRRIIMEEWDNVRLPIKRYLDKTGKSIKFTSKQLLFSQENN